MRRNLCFKASRHFRNYPSFPACTTWSKVYPLYADGHNRKLAPLASREITSPQWLSKTAFWHTERYWVHAWIVKMNKELNRNKKIIIKKNNQKMSATDAFLVLILKFVHCILLWLPSLGACCLRGKFCLWNHCSHNLAHYRHCRYH